MKLFDLHCDTLTRCYDTQQSLYQNDGQFDIHRADALFSRKAQATAIYVPDSASPSVAYSYATQVLSFLEQQEKEIPSMCVVRTKRDLLRAFNSGRCAVIPAIENGLAIADRLDKIEELAGRGIAYISVTWNGENPLGNGCMAANSRGLTPLGKEAVTRMIACGILPDVSHLNERGFWDVAALCDTAPMIASHSVSRSVHDHPRNLSDEQFAAVKRSGGVVGINVCESQLGEQSFTAFAKHIERFLSLGGEHTVALGLDLDGTALKTEWKDVSFLPSLYEFLLKMYPERVIEKIFFGNAQAFFVKTLTRKEECITIGL